MKKLVKIVALLLSATLIFTACSSKTEEKKEENKVIKIAAHVAPMTTMLEMIKEDVQKEGYTLEVVGVTDHNQANIALKNKEVDANFVQHKLFMEGFNKKNDANLAVVTPVYDAIVAIYGRDIKDIKDIKDGSSIALPNDPTNLTRALRLLAQGKLIELKDPNSYNVTVEDIKSNPKNLQFALMNSLNLTEGYKEKDLAFIYPAFASKIGLNAMKDGILREAEHDKQFVISLVAREDNKDNKGMQVVKKALASEKIKKYIEENLKDQSVVAF